MSRHHILPVSNGGQKNDRNNITVINKRKHDQFHALFSNRKPDQCIKYLVEYFWGGNWSFINEAMAKHIHQS